MVAVVVYESLWGNTRDVAEAVARGLGSGTVVIDVASPALQAVAPADLLVVGGPTHAFSMSRASTRRDAVTKGAPAAGAVRGIREWLADLPPSPHQAVATFDTRVARMGRLPGSAARAAARAVRRHRLGHTVASASFFVRDVHGPLLDGELERAERWGRELGGPTTAPVAETG